MAIARATQLRIVLTEALTGAMSDGMSEEELLASVAEALSAASGYHVGIETQRTWHEASPPSDAVH